VSSFARALEIVTIDVQPPGGNVLICLFVQRFLGEAVKQQLQQLLWHPDT